MEADTPVHNTPPAPSTETIRDVSMTEAPTEESVTIDQEASTEQAVDQTDALEEESPIIDTVTQEDNTTATQEDTTVTQEDTIANQDNVEELEEESESEANIEPTQTTVAMEGIEDNNTQQATTPPPPFLNAPASWQIPVAALHPPKNSEIQQQQQQPMNKALLRKERFELRVKENKYDVDAWTSLIHDAQQTGELDVIRNIYERFLNVFPTSPKHWLAYLELELKYSNFNEVEALFTRCLKTVLSVDLWKFYLGYIRRINLGESGSAITPEARGIIEKAYEYVLNNVGMDKDAGPIWADYIYFLKSAETSNTWEEQRKMDSMRRAYQKAVTIPLNNVEHLWKEYDQWENNLNRLTAKKFLSEKSSAYMTARTALREMRLFTDHINTNMIPQPPTWNPEELKQLELWKNYIQWEKRNPLQLEEEKAILERVHYIYQQAFLVLRFYPEIWYSLATYYHELHKPEKALATLKQGISILPTSLLLNFSFAELCESKRQLEDARQAFDLLIENLDKEIDSLKEASKLEIAKLVQEAEEERAALNLSDDIDGELREQLRSREKHVKKEQDAIEAKLSEQVEVIARAASLVWIHYMRFARRTDGIKSCRALFSRARKATNCTYHVYVADAWMEYHNSKDATVAGKVFSLGQKSYADNPHYVCQYLDFLIERNDDNNTRALFERTLATMPAEKAGPIWLKFLDYENQYGSLASIQNVEKRRIEAMGSDVTFANPMESFLKRSSFLDIQNIQDYELGYLAREQHLTDVVTGVSNTVENDVSHHQQQQQQIKQEHHHHQHHQGKDRQKKPLLEPVHPERYPRPDLNLWQPFKPTVPPVAGDVNRNRVLPAPTPSSPTVSNNIVKMDSIPTTAAAGSTALVAAETPMPPPVANNWHNHPSQQTGLPDAVAYFVSNLPPVHSFNGPRVNSNEVVEILRNVMIGPPPPQQQQQQQQNDFGGGRQRAVGGPMRGRAGGSSQRGGGGFKGRGGGPKGMKRRGGGGGGGNRDDYDDDHQTHRGMGPNRPPDFDLFRQRQAKRHRDDPPY